MQRPLRRIASTPAAGQLLTFGVAEEISPHRPFAPERQMRLINALCRFVEIAEEQAASQGASH